MNGLLVVDKPEGKSSHSVVAAVRRLTGVSRVGHSGTLDPMATGVLVLGVGQGVRVLEYLIDHDKTYHARVHLGIETDTYDATGKIVEIAEARTVLIEPWEVEAALSSFVGRIEQKPPAYSAVQRDGVRAYKLARKGIPVELTPRAVEIYSIELRSLENDEVEFDVRCSKGTFIRSLAHDLGAKLGTGAHLSGLRRLQSGPFRLDESHTLLQLEQAAAEGRFADYLLPLDLALTDFDTVHLDAGQSLAVRQGKQVPIPSALTTSLLRAYDEEGNLIALLEPASGGLAKPKKVFA